METCVKTFDNNEQLPATAAVAKARVSLITDRKTHNESVIEWLPTKTKFT